MVILVGPWPNLCASLVRSARQAEAARVWSPWVRRLILRGRRSVWWCVPSFHVAEAAIRAHRGHFAGRCSATSVDDSGGGCARLVGLSRLVCGRRSIWCQLMWQAQCLVRAWLALTSLRVSGVVAGSACSGAGSACRVWQRRCAFGRRRLILRGRRSIWCQLTSFRVAGAAMGAQRSLRMAGAASGAFGRRGQC